MKNNNIIISLMSGYKEFKTIEIFIKSALATGNKLHILYNDIGEDAIQLLLSRYPDNLKFISYSTYFAKHNVNKNLTPFNLKYVILYLYIKNYLTEEFENILFCDVNDIYFQYNPFKNNTLGDINVFGERLKIGQCITNALWCVQSYGYKQLATDYDKPVINTGMMIIKQSVILKFLKGFLQELASLLSKTNLDIADQVAFTYYYNNKLAGENTVKLHRFEDGFCIHLAQDIEMRDLYDNLKISQTEITYKDTLPAVLHQYTRDPTLINHITKKLKID